MTSTGSHFEYQDGVLSRGDVKIRDEDIVAIQKDGTTQLILHLDQTDLTLKTTTAADLPAAILDLEYQSTPQYLQQEVTVLVSVLSGAGLASAFLDGVLKPLLKAIKVPYSAIHTTSASSIKEYAATLGQKKQTLIVLSGDGGVVDILNGLPENTQHKPDLVLMPLGTANALFVSTFRASLPPYTQALRTLLQGTPKPLPNFKATFSDATLYGQPVSKLYGAVVASYGFHATLVARSDTPEYRKHGSARFGMVAQELIANPHTYKAKVNGTEGGQYVMATLVSNLESKFTVAAECKPLEGGLWLIHLTDVMEAMKGYQGLILAKKTEKMRIEMGEEGTCCVDGLIVTIADKGSMEVEVVEAKANVAA